MSILVKKRVVALLMIIIPHFLCSSIPALAQSSGFAITPIVKRGDPVSDGGRFFDCDDCDGRVIGLHAFNNRGDVAISAEVVSGTCFIANRFLITGGQSIRLADLCHTTEFGRLTFLGPVNVNDSGETALNAGVTVDNRIVEMLLMQSNGQTRKIVQEFDPSPAGGIFKGCGFGQPAINNNGEVAFFACGEKDGLFFGDGVFKYSGGQLSKMVVNNDPSPIGGNFALNFIPAQAVLMNDKGDMLFRAGVILDPFVQEKLGLFLATSTGVKKIEVDGDSMPGSGIVTPNTLGIGDLNNEGEVTFAVALTGGQSNIGIFLYSEDRISKVMATGDASPIGGTFSAIRDPERDEEFPIPRINDNGSIAFKAVVSDGHAPAGLFLASTKAVVKVATIGDRLPTGGKIRDITTFALNDFGQVAFYADVKNGPKGVFVATPVAPQISSVKLKQKRGSLELRVNGSAMITNDTVIEINGVALTALDYPSDFREDGGFMTRVVSRDSRLEQLLPEGQAVQITVFNSLTKLRSVPMTFSR